MNRFISALAALALLVGACGGSEPEIEDTWRAWTPPGGPAQPGREFTPINLPDARNAFEDRRGVRHVVNVLPGQSVVVRGMEFSFAGPADERALASEALRRELSRTRGGRDVILGLVHADRMARWPLVSTVIEAFDEQDFFFVEFAVRRVTTPELDMVMAGDIRPPRDGAQIGITLRREGAGRGRRVRIVVRHDDQVRTFWLPEGSLNALPATAEERVLWFDQANATWRALGEHLRSIAQPDERAQISVPPPGDIELACVITTIDQLLSADVRDVTFPDQGFRIVFDVPERGATPTGSDLPIGWLALALGVVLLLAFARRRR